MTDRVDDDTGAPETPDDASLRPADGDRLQPGAMVGRYRVLHRLGRGGMSEVYAAYDGRLDRGVALKIMKVDRGHQAHERLELEGRALARLGHRNVVVVHDVGSFGDEMFVAMEHVRGAPLSVRVREDPTWRELTALFVQAARGLVAAHAAHIVHRDFKPANVMVEAETDRVVVLDFGLARVRGFDEAAPVDAHSAPSGSGDSTHSAVGTPGYMAPELLRGDGASEASDQFAFCVSMFEAFYGSRPFRGRHVVELLAAMDADVLPAIPKERTCPSWLHRIIATGLRADPADRHPSMADVLDQLESGLIPPRRWVPAVVTGAAVLGLAGAAVAWAQRDPGRACSDAHGTQLAGTWNDAERSAVASAIQASDRPHAAETSPRLLARLDRFAQAWSSTALQSCDRREQTTAAHTRAVDACLGRALERMSVTTAALRTAGDDAKVADRALQLAMSLPEVAHCLDEPASDLAASPERAAASAAIARSVAARVMGDKDAAEAQSDIAVDTALTADSPGLLADARLERTRVYDALARYDNALAEASAALAVATEHDLPHRVALASMELLRLVGDRARSFEEAERWRVLARAAASRLPGDAQLHSRLAWVEGTVSWRAGALDRAKAQLEHALALTEAEANADTVSDRDEQLAGIATELGMVLDRLGDSEGARAQVTRALEIRRELFGPQHPAVADALGDLAVVAGRAGRTEDALRMGREALQIYDRGVDVDHPTAATLSMNIALELYGQGRHEEALPSFDRAVRTRSAVFGPDHLSVAYARATRAPSLAALGRTQDATRDLEAAIETIEASLGPKSPDLMGPLTNLGNIYSTLEPGRDNLPRAVAAHTRAHAIALEAMGPEHASVGVGAQNLGDLLREQGDCNRAMPYFDRALAIFTTQRGAHSAEVAYPLTSIAQCKTTDGDPQAALQPLERAAKIRAATTIDPTERGKTLLALAAAHHGVGDPRAARTAARAAIEAFADGGTAGADLKRDALRWTQETLGEPPDSSSGNSPVASD